jgi:hypothetical protein
MAVPVSRGLKRSHFPQAARHLLCLPQRTAGGIRQVQGGERRLDLTRYQSQEVGKMAQYLCPWYLEQAAYDLPPPAVWPAPPGMPPTVPLPHGLAARDAEPALCRQLRNADRFLEQIPNVAHRRRPPTSQHKSGPVSLYQPILGSDRMNHPHAGPPGSCPSLPQIAVKPRVWISVRILPRTLPIKNPSASTST